MERLRPRQHHIRQPEHIRRPLQESVHDRELRWPRTTSTPASADPPAERSTNGRCSDAAGLKFPIHPPNQGHLGRRLIGLTAQYPDQSC